MNFNKDLINHINGKTVEKFVNGAKELSGKVSDELAAGTSKDISTGLAAEDAVGRASFSMLKKSSQFEISQKYNKVCERLGFRADGDGFDAKYLKEACSRNGMLDEEFVSLAEEYTRLGELKPEKQKFCWDSSIKYLVEQSKNAEGNIDPEKVSAIKTLLKDDKISVRGIEDIIKGCTEWHIENGEYVNSFNKQAFEKYKGFMDINGKTMFEQDDVFTLYAGRTYKAVTRQESYLRKGEEHVFDNVAFNFAKKLYEQGEDIIHMEYFLKHFQTYAKEGDREVCTGFRFIPDPKNDGWAKHMIEKLKESIRDKELIEECKVNGEDSLHNLLVVDTLINDGKMWRMMAKYPLRDLKDADGYARTDWLSYALKKGGELQTSFPYDIKKCLNKNGSVNGQAFREVLNGNIYSDAIELTRVNGEINFENLAVWKKIMAKQGDAKYESYQVKEVFEDLRNKDGIVDESMIDLVDEFKKYTHLAPKLVADCMTKERILDKNLLQFKRELCQRGLAQYANELTKFAKNPDGTVNEEGVTAIRTLLDSGFQSDWYINHLIPSFTKEGKIDMEALKGFADDYAKTDPKIKDSLMWSLVNYGENTFSVPNYKALKEAMSNPEIAPLMRDSVNAKIVKAKFEPIKLKENTKATDDWTMYNFAHLKDKDIAVLEKNGYSAKFYKELGIGKKYFVETSKEAVAKFEESFLKTSKLEEKIKKASVDAPVSLTYTKEQLTSDIQKELAKLPEDSRKTLEHAFKLQFGEKGLEGFPQRMPLETIPPAGMEDGFRAINEKINKFYSSEFKSDSSELAEIYNEISSAIPEFRMIVGNTQNGERVDATVLKQLKTLVQSPEYQYLPLEEKTVAKMTVLMNSMGHVDSKAGTVTRKFHTDNDGIMLTINANWTKKGEYANSILDRFGLPEKDKYRIVQLVEDIGWAKKLEAGELKPFDVAVNQRYRGDEVISPLVERVVTGECKFDRDAVIKEAKALHKSQQLFFPAKLEEFEPYIETTVINGQELKYVDLSRPELKDKAVLGHFLGYDNFDHTLNIMRNKAYRSAFSASAIKGGEQSSQFAGRSSGIAFDCDNVNIAYTSHNNIDSGFGKTYEHLKEAMSGGGSKDIKAQMRESLNLSDEEYGLLMEQIVHSGGENEITDCVINGRTIKKDDIIRSYKEGMESILNYRGQNETTVLNPRPMAIVGLGESINDYSMSHAVNMAQANDMVLLFKPIKRG